jgi:tetraacyldisaccharide 4'-kinase
MDYAQLRKILAPVLKPASWGYAAALRLRAWLYAGGVKGSARPEVFCISVGNISWGGSGKTPVVSWILHWADQYSLRPAVLTRGYGGKSPVRPLQVKTDTCPGLSGDEPLMLAKTHPYALILADPDRRRALRWAKEHFAPDLYILDDGMQHLALQRDLNLVVLKAADLSTDWNKVIPAGPWREDESALARADAFLLRLPSGGNAGGAEDDSGKLLAAASEKLQAFNVPLFAFKLRSAGFIPLRDWPEGAGTGTISGAYVLCTAVGDPESVRASAEFLTGRPAAREFIFADHHKFSLNDLNGVKSAGMKLPVVVTAKDAVKIQPLLQALREMEILVLDSAVDFVRTDFSGQSSLFGDWLCQFVSGGFSLSGRSFGGRGFKFLQPAG